MERIAILSGLRTPMAKAGGKFKDLQADTLGSKVVREVILRSPLAFDEIDEVIIGNVAQPIHAANIARVIALRAGLPESGIAMTVHRNCASGMESITTAAAKIQAGVGTVYLCGGVESMSNIPLVYSKKMTILFQQLGRARSLGERLRVLSGFRPPFLKPVIGLLSGLTDPVTGLLMGSTAELLARDFGISRVEQDQFAKESHDKAVAARKRGTFAKESMAIIYNENKAALLAEDDGIREGQSIEKLARLRPFFDKRNGTVTAGNSSQVTDAAAALLVMGEAEAKKRGLTPLGYVRDYSYTGLDPKRMGLGPVFATSELFAKSGMSMADMDLIEINEAFAAQVLACLKAYASKSFASARLQFNSAVATIDPAKVNVNGGAIALGHPVGMTGSRLVLTLLHELRTRGLQRGLATLCIGGGQGVAFILEVE